MTSDLPRLSPAVAALRELARDLQTRPQGGIVEFTLLDAASWAARTPDEDWLVWRGRRCAGRLHGLPIELDAGELLVGKPRFREPRPDEAEALAEAGRVLADLPPYPGGDSGHFHPDWHKLLRLGIGGVLAEIDRLAARPGLTDEQRHFYQACRLAMSALGDYGHRVAAACEQRAADEPADAAHWQHLAGLCHRIAHEPPATFHEALQLMFLATVAFWFAEDHGLTTPGRLDQLLRPFYEADRAAGRLDAAQALELLSCLYIQYNRLLWPGSAVSVMVGGRDANGQDVTSELTYLCLEARRATRLVYPTVGLAWHEGTPSELTDFAVEMLGCGVGCPAFFNDELIVQGLRDHGVRAEDSFDYMNSTCVEIKVVGKSNMWVTAPYFNVPQGLLDVMAEVADGRAGEPRDFAELQQRVRDNLARRVRDAAESLDRTWQQRARTGCFPLASCLISDCLELGRDFDRGGARYNWVENSFVGLANLVDGLVAVNDLVYDTRALTLAEFHQILAQDWSGQELLRQRIVNTLPHYGNDDDGPDELARDWAQFLIETTAANTIGPHEYVPGFFCWIMHEHFGANTGATPDGRQAGWPLADGAGPAQGRERCGPTASVLSTTKWSHRPVLGGLVHNLKFGAATFARAADRQKVRQVVEAFLRRGGFELQVNVVSRDLLLAAQEHPEQHRDLLVRVAGYSDYFVHLNRNMQDEVIARTEHEL